MPIKVRQSSLGRLSTARLAAAVCWVFLLLVGARRGVLTFYTAEDVRDPQVKSVLLKSKRKWMQVPSKTQEEFVEANVERLIRRFTFSVVSSMEAATDYSLSSESYWDLVDACSHALGPIVIEMVGSRTRRTAAIQDNDLDFQVRRDPSSEWKDEPFTNIDMQKVARNLEMLNCVIGPVQVGNVAIKFKMRTRVGNIETQINVDLVLWRPRREEFPRLRGGDDFYENSARINEVVEQTPAARAAIIGIKSLQLYNRPKGLLLEAVAWRLSKTCPFPLTRTARVFAGSEEEKWTKQDGPWHLYLERELVEFFPFDAKRPSRLSKKRKKAAPLPIESGLPRAPRSRTEPRGFG